MKVEKAIEISDAKISFVSLVNKAANKRQFLITKADDGQAQFSTLGKILKVDETTHYVTGIVYEPLVEDAHGNFMTEEEIRKAAHWFAKNGDKVDLQHSFEAVEGVAVVETYVAPCDMEIGGETVIKGSWIMTAEITNTEVWEKVQKGEVTGLSMGGVGKYSETETTLAASAESAGLFARLAKALGFDVVKKGEVKDIYDESVKSSNFWSAWYALEEVLRSYNWRTDNYEFETDDAVIREALAEFSAIITDLLATPNIAKSLAKSKNNENEEEKIEMTKAEIQTTIEESVKKALVSMEPAPAVDSSEPPAEAQTVTAESIQKMIDDAIQKALNPADEPLTAESVQVMVTEAVTKAVEPILKARGISSNLNDEKPVEKSGEHYLAGII